MHIAFTLATCADWRKFVDDIKYCIKLMRAKPELNHGGTAASYGMTATIPDGAFLGELAKLHSAVILDVL